MRVCACVCECAVRPSGKYGVFLSFFPPPNSVNSLLLAASKQKGENKTHEVFDLPSCQIKHAP